MQLKTNIQEFNAGLEKYKAAIKRKSAAIAKGAALALYGRIVVLTPMKTGYARLGWRIEPSINGWVPSPPGQNHYPEPETPSRIPTSTTYWIYNNVAYILRLEHGHSDKAPGGMVGVALLDAGKALDEAAQKNGWGR
jgi:hypothetical protein